MQGNPINDSGCFVCGRDNPRGLGLAFQVDAERRTAACRATIPGLYQGWKGIAHGGMVATLLDEVCVHAATGCGPLPVTAELTVTYRKPVPLEREIRLFAEVTSRRRRLVEVNGRLEIDGEVFAEAAAKVVLLEKADLAG